MTMFCLHDHRSCLRAIKQKDVVVVVLVVVLVVVVVVTLARLAVDCRLRYYTLNPYSAPAPGRANSAAARLETFIQTLHTFV